MTTFQELVGLMARLRGPDGCAWDREQTIGDFKVHFRNESQEVLDALERKDYENLKEELGDVLWHVIFISEIARQEGRFSVEDVMDGLKEKMMRRHPHVFGGKKLSTSGEVMREYRKIKAAEKRKQ
ncbi:MAG: MazG nucleotide pyrophosphohydrolase domain-containing protein [Candidatus Altiarchaeota archaeon]